MKFGRPAGAAFLAIAVGVTAGCTSSGASPSASTPPSVLASPAPGAAITVEGAWARPSMGVADAMATYLVIRNSGSTADALIGVASDVASTVQMHETVTVAASPSPGDGMAMGSPAPSGAMMAMQPVARIEVPAGATVELKAGGYHIMLTGLKQELKAGDSFTLTLAFEKAGRLPVTVAVRAN